MVDLGCALEVVVVVQRVQNIRGQMQMVGRVLHIQQRRFQKKKNYYKKLKIQ